MSGGPFPDKIPEAAQAFAMQQADSWKSIGQTYISSRSGLARRRFPFHRRFNLEPRPSTPSFSMVILMSHRRRVFVDTPKGRRSAGFTVPETADAADVSMRLRERGWTRCASSLSGTRGSPS
jgi:hypothetical protein